MTTRRGSDNSDARSKGGKSHEPKKDSKQKKVDGSTADGKELSKAIPTTGLFMDSARNNATPTPSLPVDGKGADLPSVDGGIMAESINNPPTTIPLSLPIKDLLSNQNVDAKVIGLTMQLAMEEIDFAWWEPDQISADDKQKERDAHWQWAEILDWCEVDGGFCKTIQTSDGKIQAAIWYKEDGASKLDPNKRTIYVARLATAPRNRAKAVGGPRHQGAGSSALLLAIVQSFISGYNGRVTLSPMDDEDLKQWYMRKGFIDTGLKDDEDLSIFELDENAASAFLKKEAIT